MTQKAYASTMDLLNSIVVKDATDGLWKVDASGTIAGDRGRFKKPEDLLNEIISLSRATAGDRSSQLKGLLRLVSGDSDVAVPVAITVDTKLTTQRVVFASGSITITLKDNPQDGDQVIVKNVGSGTVTIDGDDEDIEGIASIQQSAAQSDTLKFLTGYGWRVI